MASFPHIEKQIVGDGDFQFAGPLETDPSPDIVEVAAYGGAAEIFFENTAPAPDKVWPDGIAPWWTAGGVIGEVKFKIGDGLPRPFDVRGIRVNSINVTMGTATLVVVTCAKKF